LKLLAFGVTGLLLLNLVLSYSRGCYLALALAAAVFVLIMEKRLAAFIPAGVILLPLVLPTTVMNRLMSITNLSDTSTEYRLYIWQGTIRMLERFWPSGVGQGIEAYNIVYPFYAYNAVTAPHSHNLLLQVFVETGIVGLLIFLGVIAGFYRNMVCFLRRAGRRDKILAAAMLAAVTGFLFQGMFDYVFYNYRVMLMFFIYIGLCRAFTRTAQSDICNAETGTEAGT
jgi:O-antigen ligase